MFSMKGGAIMRKVKISYSDWAHIRNYKKVHWMECACCFFRLSKVKEISDTFRVESKVYLIAYILLFIPAVVLTFFACIWDGGLKTFELPTRLGTSSYIYPKCNAHDYCEVIWDAKSSI